MKGQVSQPSWAASPRTSTRPTIQSNEANARSIRRGAFVARSAPFRGVRAPSGSRADALPGVVAFSSVPGSGLVLGRRSQVFSSSDVATLPEATGSRQRAAKTERWAATRRLSRATAARAPSLAPEQRRQLRAATLGARARRAAAELQERAATLALGCATTRWTIWPAGARWISTSSRGTRRGTTARSSIASASSSRMPPQPPTTTTCNWTRREDFMRDWKVFNTNPAIGNGYRGGTFDNRYVYLTPTQPENNGAAGLTFDSVVARYDTQESFDAATAWSAFNLTQKSGSANLTVPGYRGAAFDGRYVYFAPSFVGDSASGNVARYDSMAPFTDSRGPISTSRRWTRMPSASTAPCSRTITFTSSPARRNRSRFATPPPFRSKTRRRGPPSTPRRSTRSPGISTAAFTPAATFTSCPTRMAPAS